MHGDVLSQVLGSDSEPEDEDIDFGEGFTFVQQNANGFGVD